jgi:hypothetical protein
MKRTAVELSVDPTTADAAARISVAFETVPGVETKSFALSIVRVLRVRTGVVRESKDLPGAAPRRIQCGFHPELTRSGQRNG